MSGCAFATRCARARNLPFAMLRSRLSLQLSTRPIGGRTPMRKNNLCGQCREISKPGFKQTQPHRVLTRLKSLRVLGHEEVNKVFAGSPRARMARQHRREYPRVGTTMSKQLHDEMRAKWGVWVTGYYQRHEQWPYPACRLILDRFMRIKSERVIRASVAA